MAYTILIALLLMVTVMGIFHLLIRVGLRAPRIREQDTPLRYGLPCREVSIPTNNGKQLFGWFIAASGDTAAPVVAILHGWGGNAEMMLPLAKPLHEAGYALLFFDARCHGRSDGDSFASLPRFAADLESALEWLQVQGDVDETRVGVVGHSVGAGAALLLAAQRHDLAAVVSLSAFAHPASMMRRWLKSRRIPFWPLGAYILFYVQLVIGYRFDDIAPLRTIGRVSCPVLLAHGTEDETVPMSEAQEIYANRADKQVHLLLVPGSHGEFGDLERYIGTMTEFLDKAMGMERVKGIEPSYAAWEAAVIPLNYTRL